MQSRRAYGDTQREPPAGTASVASRLYVFILCTFGKNCFHDEINIDTTDKSTLTQPTNQHWHNWQINVDMTDKSTLTRLTNQRWHDRQINVDTTDKSTLTRPANQRWYNRQINVDSTAKSTVLSRSCGGDFYKKISDIYVFSLFSYALFVDGNLNNVYNDFYIYIWRT